MKKIFLLLIVLIYSINGISQTKKKTNTVFDLLDESPWLFVVKSTQNENWYIYENYVSKDNYEIKTWIKADFPKTTYNKKIYKNTNYKQLIICDCLGDKYKLISSILYDSHGSPIYSDDIESEYEDIVPDSVMEEVEKAICKKYNN